MTELTLPLSIIAITFLFVGGLVFFRRGRVLRRSRCQNEIYKDLIESAPEGLRKAGFSQEAIDSVSIVVPVRPLTDEEKAAPIKQTWKPFNSDKIEPPKEK